MSDELIDIARNFLLSAGDERNAAKAFLLARSGRSVFPLLKAGIGICDEFNPLPNLRRISKDHVDKNSPKGLWAHYIAEPAVRDVSEIIRAGNIAMFDTLTRTLTDKNPLVKVFIGLVLFQLGNLTNRTMEQLWRISRHLIEEDKNKIYFRATGLPYALFFLLSRSGDARASSVVESVVRKSGRTIDEYEVNLQAFLFTYLFEETGR